MDKDLAKIIMNPVRLRIIQFLSINETSSTAQIGEELSDIPQASLYRHIRALLEAGMLETTEERKTRGTVEKFYRLSKAPFYSGSEPDTASIVESCILSLFSSFHGYFAKDGNDPVKDMLLVKTLTLMLSDEEFTELLQKIGKLYEEALSNKADGVRKPRRLTLISSPCED